MVRRLSFVILALAASTTRGAFAAEDFQPETWNAKFQATYIRQVKPSMNSPYAGPNSLSGDKETSYSFTTTASLGLKLWKGGEVYFNPEAAQGVPLSGLTGLGGFTNGEMARSSGARLKFYRARLFVRQTIGLGGGTEQLESDANQLAQVVDKNRITVTLGNVSVIDIFDNNTYAHDPRTQFMNWSIMTHGAYDFAADARGYTWGAAVEWQQGYWAARIGRFVVPKEPNQQILDPKFLKHYGDQVEIEHAHEVFGQPGRVRLLAFHMHARMANFQDAINYGAANGTVPSIDDVRDRDRSSHGYGINLEQQVTPDIGVFARWSRGSGKTETYAFTEIDQSLSGGVSIKGSAWKRGDDTVGIAFARNQLSNERRSYLAQGGISFFIGDGRLNYAPEVIGEAYYNAQLTKAFSLSLDWQHIARPAYNADRGPANFFALRGHLAF